MTINIPGKAQQALRGSMQTKASIELPFPCPAWYVINGNIDLEELKNSLYFGGWGCGTEKIKKSSEKFENLPYPIPGFYEIKRRDDHGNQYSILSARSLIFASIGMRMFSVKKVNGKEQRVAPFTKGASPAIQVLGVLAYKNEQKQITPYAPIMLSASGYQVNHVRNSFAMWRKAITPHVKNLVAPETDLDSALSLFWMYIGTFGERNSVPAGEKSITPISAFIPEDLDDKKVENLYVGDPMAEFMADIHQQSQEWLDVYKMPEPNAAQAAQVYAPQAGYIDEPLPPEDDIPF